MDLGRFGRGWSCSKYIVRNSLKASKRGRYFFKILLFCIQELFFVTDMTRPIFIIYVSPNLRNVGKIFIHLFNLISINDCRSGEALRNRTGVYKVHHTARNIPRDCSLIIAKASVGGGVVQFS